MSEAGDNILRYTDSNRRAWNEIAQVRSTTQPPAEFFAELNSTLDARELLAAGDVRGRRLLHLQCATGEGTLSWSLAGAEATGVDISEKQIELARRKAERQGCPPSSSPPMCTRSRPNYSLATSTSSIPAPAVMVWLPDLQMWAASDRRGIEARRHLPALRRAPAGSVPRGSPTASCASKATTSAGARRSGRLAGAISREVRKPGN